MENSNIENKIGMRDIMFMVATEITSWRSKDPNKQVGAIIGCPDGTIVAKGINDLPPGIKNREKILNNREAKLRCIIHAEKNAILNAREKDLIGCSIYVYPLPPCADCAEEIIRANIKRVVSPVIDQSSKWWESTELGKRRMKNAGLDVVEFEINSIPQLMFLFLANCAARMFSLLRGMFPA